MDTKIYQNQAYSKKLNNQYDILAMRQNKLETMLRRARNEVFSNDNRENSIKWIKRELQKYWQLERDFTPDNSAMKAIHGW